MTRFALTKTTPLLLGMLALAACPGDDTPQDTEGTSTGDDTTSMGPTTTPMTTIEPDSGSGSGSGSSSEGTTAEPTTGGPVCDPECEAGECCVAGNCFSAPEPTCDGGCADNEDCVLQEGTDPCEAVGECVPTACGVDGNYDPCFGVECEAGYICLVDSTTAPTISWCALEGCGDACDCPIPPEGFDAACMDLIMAGSGQCFIECAGDACPDGMSCFMGICVWEPPPPPAEPWGDCQNNPGSCTPEEDGCLQNDAAMPTAGACTETGCGDATDCAAAPATGTAVVACDDLGDGNTCYLDCSAMGSTCPDGMECIDVGMGMTSGSACLWPGQTLLLEEDFESGMLGAGWTVIDVDGHTPDMNVAFVTDAFVVADEFEPGANFGAYSTSWYAPAGASDDWLVTPQITLGTGTSVAWEGWAPDGMYPDGYELRISTGMPTVVDFMANAPLFTIADEAQMFTGHVVDLAAAGYASQDVYLAWRNNSNDEFILVIDNISVVDAP